MKRIVLSACSACVVLLAGCEDRQYDYLQTVEDRPDITEVVECEFAPSTDGWERYTCLPVFSAADPLTEAWESSGIGDFDILQREIFGAPFYQLWYTGQGPLDSQDIGYAVSMDATNWIRHPFNPVLRRGITEGAFDRDSASVACLAFDGELGRYHLWYTGTNSDASGTTFGHATSTDGVAWSKDRQNPLNPLSDATISRVWGCDALYEDGRFHLWYGGVTRPAGITSIPDLLEFTHYDIGYMSTLDGVNFDVVDEPVFSHSQHDGDQFDAEGVHKPSVFAFGEGDDKRYWMVYAGYEDVIATQSPPSNLIFVSSEGQSLGVASAPSPEGPWERESGPVPLDLDGTELLDSPRAFFINGRLHVFFTDSFVDEDGDPFTGIGLGIAPFPVQAVSQ